MFLQWTTPIMKVYLSFYLCYIVFLAEVFSMRMGEGQSAFRNVDNIVNLQHSLANLENDSMIWYAHHDKERENLVLDGAASLVRDSPANFDITWTTYPQGVSISAADQIPHISDDTEPFIQDMNMLANLMKEIAREDEKIVCRLALMNGVRCPKWHEDYVNLRLIKSYYGPGTDWASVDDWLLGIINAARSRMGHDMTVPDNKVTHAVCGDLMVIAGKKRREYVRNAKPVLHRSPITDPVTKRLLFTVTLT